MDYTTIEDFTSGVNVLIEDTAPEVVTATLAEAIQRYSTAVGIITSLKESNDSLRDENERLKKANMELYLRVTTTKDEVEEKEEEVETMEFEDLFDEDGRLM